MIGFYMISLFVLFMRRVLNPMLIISMFNLIPFKGRSTNGCRKAQPAHHGKHKT